MKPTIATYLAGEAARQEIDKVIRRIWDEIIQPRFESIPSYWQKGLPIGNYVQLKGADDALWGHMQSFAIEGNEVRVHTSSQPNGDYPKVTPFVIPLYVLESENPIPSANMWATTYFEGLIARIQADIDAQLADIRARELAQLATLRAKYPGAIPLP